MLPDHTSFLKKLKEDSLFFYLSNIRKLTVTRYMLGKNFIVYNGKSWKNFTVRRTWLGDKLGDYFPTRNFGVHLKKKKKKR